VTPQKVQVFALGQPAKNTPKGKRRYYVRWRVEGRDRMRSFKTKAEAEHVRSLLQQAVREQRRFDIETGMPEEWASTKHTWWTWSREWLALKWPGWSGNSRRTGVESLVAIAPHMVTARAPRPTDQIAPWLREAGFNLREQVDESDPAAKWLERDSIPLDQIVPRTLSER
jgi:hypothetical protein